MAGIINAMAMRQAVMANTPHMSTASGSMASFSTDMVGKLRHLVVGIEPVQAGSGDPSPENIRPITGRTGANVTRTGKNLFDDTWFQNSGGVKQEDGSWYIQNLAYVGAGTVVWKNPGYTGQFALSLKHKTINKSGSGGGRFIWKYKDGSNVTIYINNSTDYIEVTNISDGNKIVEALLWDYGSSINSTWFKEVQLEVGTTISAYEPFGTIYPISWQSEAGTVYGATIDVVTGVLTVDRAMVTFDGSDMANMKMETTTSDQKRLFIGRQRFVPASASPSASSAVGNIRSNQYKTASADATYTRGANCIIASRSNGAYIYDQNLQSIESFSAAWQTTPLQVVYELFVHQTYQLPQTMVKSLIGTNHVWADTGDVESLTYWTH